MSTTIRMLGALAALASGLGCIQPTVVERAYGGDVVEGRYVSPEAYAAFLRGAMAEAGQHPAEALQAYGEAAARDPRSPEPWTRIAEVRCRTGGREGAVEGEAAAAHALALDPLYARAWGARATCAAARGDAKAARDAAQRAARLDPQGDGANILLARADATGAGSAGSREVLVALTVTAAEPVAAWDALASWAEAHGDVALWTRALVELARVAPEKRAALAQAAGELAGSGNLGEAREVAAAVVDASAGPLPPTLALVARMAVDEAIGRRDVVAVRRRVTRGRLTLDEAGGRALLAGERALAHDLVAGDAGADPGALGARLVLAVADGRDLVGAATSARPGDAPVAAAALVAFGSALLHAVPGDARAIFAGLPRVPPIAGDDRVVRAAVELASRGVFPAAALPTDGVIELDVILNETPPRPVADDALDARHRYLSLALTQPLSPQVRDLAERLHGVIGTDPVVAVAAALIQLAGAAPIAPDAPHALLALNPADPLLAATALRLAEKVGDADVARRARAALGVIALPRRSL